MCAGMSFLRNAERRTACVHPDYDKDSAIESGARLGKSAQPVPDNACRAHTAGTAV